MRSLIPAGSTSLIAHLYGVGSDGSLLGSPSAETFSGPYMADDLSDWLSEAIPAETSLTFRDADIGDLWLDVKGHFYADIRDPETERVVAHLRIYPERKAVSYPAVDTTVRREDLHHIEGEAA